jgi:hypothetical protein
VCPPYKWDYTTIETINCDMIDMRETFVTYEQAALAGIEYCLNNLI